MTLLPTTFTSILKSSIHFDIADLLSKPLPTHRFASVLEAIHPIDIDTASAVDSLAPVAPTTAVANSNLVPLFDTGAYPSVCHCSISDFLLPVAQASYGLNQSPLDFTSNLVFNPYTLITGEDILVDLSFPDLDLDSYSDPVFYTFQEFGTATLVYIYSQSLELLNILVEPSLDPVVDWLHWIPLPRLTPTGTYFHISGLDYLQAFALFHLIPIWITLVLALLPFRFE